ncbi:hypothetical protein [uncultured Algibacter sp.]|uniref:hypothetical protein n=1 Tax=uncultured Algibacter sp. TaxID=298659 RepID=UPI003216EC53
MSNFWSFSQSLKPKILSIKGETHFCFTVAQSKIIAEQLQQKVYADSIVRILQNNTERFKKLLVFKDDIIHRSKTQTSNLNHIANNQKTQINGLELDLKKEKKKGKRRSFFTKVGGVFAIITGILLFK